MKSGSIKIAHQNWQNYFDQEDMIEHPSLTQSTFQNNNYYHANLGAHRAGVRKYNDGIWRSEGYIDNSTTWHGYTGGSSGDYSIDGWGTGVGTIISNPNDLPGNWEIYRNTLPNYRIGATSSNYQRPYLHLSASHAPTFLNISGASEQIVDGKGADLLMGIYETWDWMHECWNDKEGNSRVVHVEWK